jgi:hypothetical protein
MDSYQVDGVCYYSPSSALSAMAARMFGSGVDSSGRVYQFATAVSGDSLLTTSTLGQTSLMTPVLQPCQLLDWQDAAILSGFVVVAMVAAFSMTILQKAVHE